MRRASRRKNAYAYADYNAFFSPDNQNKTNYDFAGAGAHDVADGSDGQLASNPFAGARIVSDDSRMIESTIDEAAIWQGTQGVSQVLAIFRERYSPKAGSPIIDAGDPKDNDAQGRRIDIGAIDLSGHDEDSLANSAAGRGQRRTSRLSAPMPAQAGKAAAALRPVVSSATGGTSAAVARRRHGGLGGASGMDAAIGGRSCDGRNGRARCDVGGEHNLKSGCSCSVIGRERRADIDVPLAFGLFSAVALRRGARRRVRPIAIAAGVSLACFAPPRISRSRRLLRQQCRQRQCFRALRQPLANAATRLAERETRRRRHGRGRDVRGARLRRRLGNGRGPHRRSGLATDGARRSPRRRSGSTEDFIQLSSCSFVTIDGFEVSGAPRSGIAILGNQDDGSDARGVIIQNCYSHNNGGTSVAGRHDGIFSGFALDLTIQDNRIDTTGEHGIYVSNAADNPAILRNDVSNTGANCIQINADLSTGGDGLISNWRIEGNTVRDCKGAAGFNLDGAIRGVARNNVIFNAAKAGITLFQGDGAEASHDNLIVNNTVYNPAGSRAAIQVAAAPTTTSSSTTSS